MYIVQYDSMMKNRWYVIHQKSHRIECMCKNKKKAYFIAKLMNEDVRIHHIT